MALARSTVQVSIVSQLGQGFGAAFQTANARMQGLRKAVDETSKAVGNIDAFRRQSDVVKQAGYQWQAAKIKADQFRDAINAQGAPTKKQAAELARLEAAAGRAGDKFAQQREKLAQMGRELQRAGVNAGKLTAEYKRLTAQLEAAQAKHARMEQSLARQQRIVSAMGATWRGIAGAAVSVTAAGAVLAGPTRKAMTYDESLSRLADTASNDPGEYKTSKEQLSSAVQAALKDTQGGNRDEAIAALNALIATGGQSVQEATQSLPAIMRTAFASKTSADQIANIALKLGQFGIQDQERALDILYRSGRAGGVELSNMAQHLPEQLGAARMAGYGGERGLAEVGSMNQVALSTSGSADQAANNVTNLLNKVSSRELTDRIKKEIGVDFDQYALANKQRGIGKVESFVMLAERELSGNKRYEELKKGASTAANDKERGALYKEMAEMMNGTNMGQLITDRQALAAAIAYQNSRTATDTRDPTKSVLQVQIDSSLNGQAGVRQSQANLSGETWAKSQVMQNTLDEANKQTFDQLAGPLGKVLDTANGLAEKFPGLTAGAYAAGTALSALAAGIAGSAIWGMLTKGGAAGAAGKAASTAATSGAAASAAGAFSKGGFVSGAMRLLGPLSMMTTFANATTPEQDAVLDKSVADERAKMAQLTQQYGRETLEKAFKAKAPWYQLGGVDSAKPDRVEAWVKEFVAERQNKQPAAALQGQQNQPASKAADGGPAAVQEQQSPLAAKVIESSTAASEAARAASEAATAAQNRPNVTQTNNYNVTVQTPAQPGALELGDALNKALRDRERQKEADLRGSFLNQPQF